MVDKTNILKKIRLSNILLVSRSIITVFAIFFATLSFVPLSFADHSDVSVSIPQGSSQLGCEATYECFVPNELVIDVGSQVTWSNDDTASHTVTSGTIEDSESQGQAFDSSLFMAGQTYSHTFSDAGTFPYFCMVHPWMVGEVIVSAGAASSISFSNLRITDISGNPLSKINLDKQVLITAHIVNNQDSQQSFAYVVEIRDEDGFTKFNAWQTGVLNPSAAADPGLSHTFDSPRNYQIIARLFDSVQNPQILAPQLSLDVSITSEEQPQIITINTDESSYAGGDTITIAGTVSPIVGSTKVAIQVFSKTNALVRIDQVDVLPSGNYVAEIVAGGALWDNNEGTFTIKATYNQKSAQKQIQYLTSIIEEEIPEKPPEETPEPIDKPETNLDTGGEPQITNESTESTNFWTYGIIAVVAIGGSVAAFAMMKRKSSKSEEGQTSKPPTITPQEKEPDYSLDDSKLK